MRRSIYRISGMLALMLGVTLSACGGAVASAPTSVPLNAPTPSSAPTAPATSVAAPTLATAATPAAGPTPQALPVGDGTVVAIGGSSNQQLISVLTTTGWQPPVAVDLGSCLGHSNAFADAQHALWAVCSRLFTSTDQGAHWSQVKVPFTNEYDTIEVATLDAHDHIWLASTTEVVVLNAKDGSKIAAYAARTTTKETYFPHEAISVTPDGVVWLGGLNIDGSALVSFDGHTWTAYGTPEAMGVPSYATPNALYVNQQGALQVVTGAGIFAVNNNKLAKVDDIDTAVGTVTQVVATHAGDLFMASFSGLAQLSDAKTTLITRADGLPSNTVRSVALDDAGRPWVATDYGIAVRDGSTWHTAVPSTSGLGMSRVSRLLVLGAPALPPAESTVKTTSVSGRVVEHNKPVAHTNVQLCGESPSMIAEVSPCENQPFQQITETDADGRFAFTGVPLATYGIAAVNSDGKWLIFLSDIDGRAGDRVDLGEIDVTKQS